MSYVPFPPIESMVMERAAFWGALEFSWGPHKKEPTIIANKISTIGLLVDDMEPPMAIGREFLIDDMQDRFDREVDLNGVPWKKRNPEYRKWLRKHGYGSQKILRKDNDLIEAVTDRNSYKVTRKTLSIDTSDWPVYWHAHNVGSKVGKGVQLPKREFLGMSEDVAFSLVEVFDDYVQGFLRVIWPKSTTNIPMQRGAFGRISNRITATDVTRGAAIRKQLKEGT